MSTDRDHERLRARLPSLPRRIEPPQDLWPGIAPALARAPAARPGGRRLPLTLAAALAVVVGLGFLAAGDRGSAPPGVRVAESPASPPDAGRVYGTAIDLMYSGALRALASQTRPPPALLADELTLELRAIERATAEIRAALKDDPEAVYLAELLASTHRKRVQLLRAWARAADEERMPS